jgi:hypothetical protein
MIKFYLFCLILFLERAGANELKEGERIGVSSDANITIDIERLHIPDQSTLSQLVADRLDLPMSTRLLNQSYDLSIITQCWKDQLRLKRKLNN